MIAVARCCRVYLAGVSLIATSAWSAQLPETAYRTYAQNYKDAALAYCVSQAYAADGNAHADASASANGIDNWGEYDLENSSGKVPELVKEYLSRDYQSKHGHGTRLNLMKCLDMYHSVQLQELVEKYVPHPEKSYAGSALQGK
ncbi:T6SS amidase immunity protein Tai4 family protein [Winslowiella iniecta]|uniref:Type VI secretion protein n=1 Tax=Winslowiella iniecta TaxID=1560201 RepID=A0A0L7T3K3_9GAMM|nr:T6SS amidase immunity protein Tai4 family protein [Winslowiella iniecta]KOC89984.1 hypothetical protein NG42_10935 [Winslowiella iniecta]KOC94388.1 hypothetical protein NG43_05585 [Winslowiella iniecta]